MVIPQLTFKSLDEPTLLSLRRRSIKAWSQRDVGTFLKTQGLEEYQSAFKEKKISGPALIGLNDEDLKEMGVSRKKERTALLKAVSTATAASTPNAVASYESAQKKSAKKKQQQASYDDDDVADAVKVEAQTGDVESDSIAAIPNIKGLIGIILFAVICIGIQLMYQAAYKSTPEILFQLLSGSGDSSTIDKSDMNKFSEWVSE